MPDNALNPLSSWTRLPLTRDPGAGVLVADREGLAIAAIALKRDAAEDLTSAIRRSFGLELPPDPRRVATDEIAFIGTGPRMWLATSGRDANTFAAGLQESLGGHGASVCDQSGAYAALRLTGVAIRRAFSKILPLDLHPRQFRIADAASTRAAHIAVTLWRLGDAPDGAPVFELLVPRSFAGSFWDIFADSAAEYGLAACSSTG